MRKIRKFIFFILLAFVFLTKAGFVFAAEAINVNNGLPGLVKFLFEYSISLSGLLALCVITFGGVLYLIDMGMGRFKGEAIEWIKAGMLGLLLSVSSYLILWTINPALVNLRLNGLVPVASINLGAFTPPTDSPEVITYSEIPVGTLTENVLTRAIDCYDFDENGDPIDGKEVPTDNGPNVVGPTLLKNDRVDCFTKLGKAVTVKAGLLTMLADRIKAEMNKCACGSGSGSSGACVNKDCHVGDCKWPYPQGQCTASYIGQKAGCSQPCQDTCSNKGCEDQSNNSKCCPDEAVETMEHGPIYYTDLSGQIKEYKGLEEFKSDYNYDYTRIKNEVEKTPPSYVNGDIISIIDTGNCDVCDQNCECSDKCLLCTLGDANCLTHCNELNNQCQANQPQCVQDKLDCQNNRKNCLKDSTWGKLSLADQIVYLNGKMTDIETGVKADLNELKNATKSLSSCYLADSATDFVKTLEETNEKNYTILVNKDFKDPVKNKTADAAKYCEGFEYGNSSCYSQCQKMCPATNLNDFQKYNSCEDCENTSSGGSSCQTNNPSSSNYCAPPMSCTGNLCCRTPADGGTCQTSNPSASGYCGGGNSCVGGMCCNTASSDRESCLIRQANCVKEKYNERKCLPQYSHDFDTFNECFATCKLDCAGKCDLISDQYAKQVCIEKCQNNSKCLSDNQDKCLMDFNELRKCSIASTGKEDELLKCPETSALCQYCSDQYSGYQDCLKCPACRYAPNSSLCTDCINGDFSSSNLYYSPDKQKCKNPYAPVSTSASTSGGSTSGNAAICLNLYQETAKCPASSKCPECPCDLTDEMVNYPATQAVTSPPDRCKNNSGGSNGTDTAESNEHIEESRACSANCDTYKYNQDPLTFYCRQDWWLKPETKNDKPIGENMICPKEQEIPVGQAIDNTNVWANNLTEVMTKNIGKVSGLIEYIKKIGRQENYCECNSKCGDDGTSGDPVCQAKCILGGSPGHCACTRTGCEGNPCQKMINLFDGKTALQDCEQNVKYDGLMYHFNKVNESSKDVLVFQLRESRSDIVKQLTYSRTKTTSCGVNQNNFEAQKRALSCSRILDEVISPTIDKASKVIAGGKIFNSYCYGKYLNKIPDSSASFTDNWFCCEDRTDLGGGDF